MKSPLTQQRFKAPKKSACGLCKPQKRGWAGKRKVSDIRFAIGHEQQLRETRSI